MHAKFLFFAIGALALITGAITVSVSPAHAQYYVSGNVGVTILRDAGIAADSFTVLGVGVVAEGETEFDTGYGLSGAIGHAWGPFRLEGELSYRKNDLDKVTTTSTGVATFDLGGDTSSFGFMANGYYDFDTSGPWAPFLMAGIGGARLNLDITSVAGTAFTYDESDTVFAYQAGAGLGYKISPTTTTNLQYRFFGTADPTFDDGVHKIDAEYQSHNIWAGITVRF